MNLKQDKEFEKRSDIVFLSEIITNSMYWQEIVKICKSIFFVTNKAFKYIVLLLGISRYPKK
jgi:hypothetical protein